MEMSVTLTIPDETPNHSLTRRGGTDVFLINHVFEGVDTAWVAKTCTADVGVADAVRLGQASATVAVNRCCY